MTFGRCSFLPFARSVTLVASLGDVGVLGVREHLCLEPCPACLGMVTMLKARCFALAADAAVRIAEFLEDSGQDAGIPV